MSQSPSLRGSGRFHVDYFHSPHFLVRVSIPFIAGQWSLRGHDVGVAQRRRRVSIPFIAGQWSLPHVRLSHAAREVLSQSPSLRGSGRFVHGGAAIRRRRGSQSPSLRGSGRFVVARLRRILATLGLNPLHCGAVVASGVDQVDQEERRKSQSPSLRGSGRFEEEIADQLRKKLVSIPFIAGQWSLPRAQERAQREVAASQSPSLRGSGRFLLRPCLRLGPSGLNPLHCGAVVASRHGRSRKRPLGVSIPFIAGQWSLPDVSFFRAVGELASLNPLHCGAVVAS